MTSFPHETLDFLSELRAHNDKTWFDANRDRYEAGYVAPAKAFVEAAAPRLDELVPGINAEPRVLGSIFRINRDVRFSSDKRPYKDHLDLWFWEGDRKTTVSGLFLRVAPDEVVIGAGAHGFDRGQLARYRAAVVAPDSGGELAAVVADVQEAGGELGGETYARTPKGFAADGFAERLLRYSALHVSVELPPAAATKAGFLDVAVDRWAAFVPLHRWLQAHVGAR